MLEPMSDAEAERDFERIIAVFAEALVAAREWPDEEARIRARRKTEEVLPQGACTPGHHFRNIVIDGGSAGTLWFAEQLDETPPRVYVFDIAVDEDRRGHGIGSRALGALEEEARALGAQQIMLSVFHHNAGAVRLYSRLGYVPGERDEYGMRMAKAL